MIGEMKSDWLQAAEAFGMTPAFVGFIVVAPVGGCSVGSPHGASRDASHAVPMESQEKQGAVLLLHA